MRTFNRWLTLMFLFPIPLFAQQKVNISGRTLVASADGKGQEALPYANILVLESKDSTLVKGVTSRADGHFRISFFAQREKSYLLKASYTGMKSQYRKLNLRKANSDIGNVILAEGLELSEVVVSPSIKETDMAGDTTLINADAYKTPEGANLEKLVKKIPGLEYDKGNNYLVYNGVVINEINVNGEPFFAGNHALALENLPANLVSKIKVYDKRSEMEKFTGVNAGGENYVLDLQTKKEFNGTIITSAAVGRGNNKKKEEELISNFFKAGGENLSAIARSGNREMTSVNKDNRQDNIAVNFLKKFGEKIHLSGNAMYNNSIDGNEGTSYYEQYLTAKNSYQYTAGKNRNTSTMANAILGMKWEMNKKTLFNAWGSFNIQKGSNNSSNRQASYHADPKLSITGPFSGSAYQQIEDSTRVNDIRMNANSSNTNRQYSFNADFTRKLNEKGSSLGVEAQYLEGRGANEAFSISSTTYYQLKDAQGNDSILRRKQYQDSPTRNSSLNLGLILTQPLHKGLRAQLSYKFNWESQNSDRNTYDLSPFLNDEEEISAHRLPQGYRAGYTDSLSNKSLSNTMAHEISFNLDYAGKMWKITTGLSITSERQGLNQKTGRMKSDTLRHSINYRPTFTILWRREKTRVQLSYNGNTQQPGLADLLTLTDNSDPLNITRGNPHLKPSYNQRARIEARDVKTGLSGDVNWTSTLNSVTQALSYDPQTGGIESYPVNINGNWSTKAALRYRKRIKRRFEMSARTGASFIQNAGIINEGQGEASQASKTRNMLLNGGIRLSYQPGWGGFDFNGDWSLLQSMNRLRETSDYARNYSFGLDVYANLPGNVYLQSKTAYTFRNGTNITKGEDDEVLWNIRLSWSFLRHKKAELSAYWADILSQKKNYGRKATSGGLSEWHTQQIGSYFIVSFKYHFNKRF